MAQTNQSAKHYNIVEFHKRWCRCQGCKDEYGIGTEMEMETEETEEILELLEEKGFFIGEE